MEEAFYLQLLSIKGISKNEINDILKISNSFEEAIQNIKSIYHYMDYKMIDFNKIKNYCQYLESIGIKILHKKNQNYPNNLKEFKDSPNILYAKGNTNIINTKRVIGITGSRNININLEKKIRTFIQKINNNYLIASGLAFGTDKIAHEESLNTGTIAFIGHGLGSVYPKSNQYLFDQIIQNNGCILSEFEYNEPILTRNFPKRNKLIVQSSDYLFAFHPKNQSGTLGTINIANKINKKVFIYHKSNSKLSNIEKQLIIDKKVELISDIDQIFDDSKTLF